MFLLSDVDLNNVARIKNLLDPSSAQDAATKAYVDSLIQGLKFKNSVRAASTANINLSSPGSTIDGVTMVSGDRFLAKDQTTASQNGIYIWNGSAVTATRSTDADTFNELEAAVVSVEEGTTNVDTTYIQTAVNGTIGSTSVTFQSFGTSIPDASTSTKGKVQLATTTEASTGTDTAKVITPAALAGSVWAKKKFTATVGDGSATQYDLTHNFGTRDIDVRVYRNSGNFDDVLCDVSRPDTNTARLNFASPPSTNQFAVVILA